MEFVELVRFYAKDRPLEEAVDQTVDECIRWGILAEFLQLNRAEVTKMSIFEYDGEKVKRLLRKDAYDDGMEDGKAEDILDLLEDIGTVPDGLLEKIKSEKDLDTLRAWLKLAARAESMESFERSILEQERIGP